MTTRPQKELKLRKCLCLDFANEKGQYYSQIPLKVRRNRVSNNTLRTVIDSHMAHKLTFDIGVGIRTDPVQIPKQLERVVFDQDANLISEDICVKDVKTDYLYVAPRSILANKDFKLLRKSPTGYSHKKTRPTNSGLNAMLKKFKRAW